jgi:DNA-binding beta-propeller fold protein YncE
MNKSLLLLTCTLAFTTATAQHHLEQLWATDTVLKVPESVLFDGRVLYVANIDGKEPWTKDGQGSIGQVGLDGKILHVEWVKGLSAPKGMGLHANKLYVADIDEVVVIDVAKAAIVQHIPVAGAKGLNDIAIDAKGVVYVSDMHTGKVHRIENGVATVLLHDLKWVNGLMVDGNELFLLNDGGLYRVGADGTPALIASGMEGGTDGVERVDGKDFVVSCWEGALWYVQADGTKELLLDTRAQGMNTADIGYDPVKRIVYVPTFWKNGVVAYQLVGK